jgi:hypothetical protein
LRSSVIADAYMSVHVPPLPPLAGSSKVICVMQMPFRRMLDAWRADAQTHVVHQPSTVTAVPLEVYAARMLRQAADQFRVEVPSVMHVGSLNSTAAQQCNVASEALGQVADANGRCAAAIDLRHIRDPATDGLACSHTHPPS